MFIFQTKKQSIEVLSYINETCGMYYWSEVCCQKKNVKNEQSITFSVNYLNIRWL